MTANAAPRKSMNGCLLAALIMGGAALVMVPILIALLLPAINAAREAARRNICITNQKQIALAIFNYESANGHLPPAYTVDENGRPLHSWRVLILPYMEEFAMYEQLDLTKPWDDPVNLAVTQGNMPDFFRCPSDAQVAGVDYTNYMVVVDANSAFPPGGKEVKVGQIRDGISRTLGVIETAGPGVFWAEPTDVTLPELGKIGSDHAGGIFIGSHLDGSTSAIPADTPPEELEAMIDIAGPQWPMERVPAEQLPEEF
ncbi:MAG: DUF1559 domain-containing protein [Pirellulaceae bacterium]